jgi:glycosyltransferase involved in cell wall biosynthesis
MGLKADGNQVTFVAQSSMDLQALPTLGSACLTYRWNRWERLGMWQRVRLAPVIAGLKKNPPDVLLVWGSCDAAHIELLRLVQHAVPTPMVVWAWDASELFSPVMALANVRQIIASSRPIAERAGARADASVPVTVVLPGAYADEAVACFDVEGQVPCLVALDPLSDRRAYASLFEACKQVADAGLDYLLFAYDTGSDEYTIWRDVEKIGLLDRVSFVPFHQDAEPLLLHGDLYLHALASPRVQYRTLEAMGKGLVVVSSPNQGADYLVDRQNCRIVHERTAEGWRAVLTELIEDRAGAIALARRAQQHIREHHSMIRTIVQFTSLCRQISGVPLAVVGR